MAVKTAEPFRLVLEADGDIVPMERLIGHLVASLPVVDLTVEEPPLEEVIRAIYGTTVSP